MDERYKPDKYLEYLNLLGSTPKEQDHSPASKDNYAYQLNTFENKLINMSDAKENDWLFYGILSLFFCVLILQLFFIGFTWRLTLILPLLVMLIMSRAWIKRELKRLLVAKANIPRQGAISKIIEKTADYLHIGLDVKTTRHKIVKFSFLLFFPLILTFIAELIQGAFSFKQLALSLITAGIFSSGFWLWYFYSEESHYNDLRDELDGLIPLYDNQNENPEI